MHGISSSEALTAVHSRPPKRGTANVYGIRRNDPTRFGTAVSQNSSPRLSAIPALARFRTTIVQRTQTLKPMCSAKIDRARFLRATERPSDAQKRSSSGRQSSIQRPREKA